MPVSVVLLSYWLTSMKAKTYILESMILAQIERWQRALYMQVERETPPSGRGVERRKGE